MFPILGSAAAVEASRNFSFTSEYLAATCICLNSGSNYDVVRSTICRTGLHGLPVVLYCLPEWFRIQFTLAGRRAYIRHAPSIRTTTFLIQSDSICH